MAGRREWCWGPRSPSAWLTTSTQKRAGAMPGSGRGSLLPGEAGGMQVAPHGLGLGPVGPGRLSSQPWRYSAELDCQQAQAPQLRQTGS